MGQVAPNCYSYLHYNQWVREGAPWQPPDIITLRDEAGLPLGTTVIATMLMTLYNVETEAIVNDVDGTVDVKNTRGCSLSPQGVFVLRLGSPDTIRLDSTHGFELRRALIQYTWPLVPTKQDSLEVTFIVKGITYLS